MVQIQAKFKKDDGQYDGLEAVAKELVDKPLSPRIVVAVIDVTNVNHNILDGTDTAKVRFRQVEVLDGDAAARALELMNTRYGQRTGRDDSQASLFDAWSEPVADKTDEDPRSAEEIMAERAEARAAGEVVGSIDDTLARYGAGGNGPDGDGAPWPGDVAFVAPPSSPEQPDGDEAETPDVPADQVGARRSTRKRA